MILGIGTAFLQIGETRMEIAAPKLDYRFLMRLFAVSVVWLVVLHVFVRLVVRWSE